ncbi:MAG: ribosome small subunit-dependent GTPase A [Phycisphaerales bacterium]|nr:MAG: ribosome small subunit-dependent GTPase A [Phycisphaerales bacterium]
MADQPESNDAARPGRKVRVDFRRNRTQPPRTKDWTRRALEVEDHELDEGAEERVLAKGDLSRRRTIIVDGPQDTSLAGGVVIALRGQFSEVDDGRRVWMCTVRRVVRTLFSKRRHPLAVGDRVLFRPIEATGEDHSEGVIEAVEPRRGELKRRVKRRIHTIVANVDQVIIVSATDQPPVKPHLIDRYVVSAAADDVAPAICLNKMDLAPEAEAVLERYRVLGYETLTTCALSGEGVDRLRELLAGRASAIVGQSGVGKSALLNAVQPGLGLRVGEVSQDTGKGRHTTTTATLIRLEVGGYIADTPGVRSFDLSTVGRHDLERLFIEFAPLVEHCKFPDCSHTHEGQCAIKAAVEGGTIHPERYESYVRLYQELPETALR